MQRSYESAKVIIFERYFILVLPLLLSDFHAKTPGTVPVVFLTNNKENY